MTQRSGAFGGSQGGGGAADQIAKRVAAELQDRIEHMARTAAHSATERSLENIHRHDERLRMLEGTMAGLSSKATILLWLVPLLGLANFGAGTVLGVAVWQQLAGIEREIGNLKSGFERTLAEHRDGLSQQIGVVRNDVARLHGLFAEPVAAQSPSEEEAQATAAQPPEKEEEQSPTSAEEEGEAIAPPVEQQPSMGGQQ